MTSANEVPDQGHTSEALQQLEIMLDELGRTINMLEGKLGSHLLPPAPLVQIDDAKEVAPARSMVRIRIVDASAIVMRLTRQVNDLHDRVEV